MKKAVIFLLMVSIVFIISISVSASNFNQITVTGLGYSINLIDSSEISIENIKTDQPVLDASFFDNATIVRTNVLSGSTRVTEGDDIHSYYEDEFLDIINEVGVSAKKGVLSAGTKARFGYSLGQSIEAKSNNYYYSLYSESVQYALSIQNHKTNKAQFTNHLSTDYVNELASISDELDWRDFFNIYGTHLVTGLKFGGKMRMNYKVSSDYINFDSSLKNHFSNEINAKVTSVVSGTSTSTIDFGIYENRSRSLLTKELSINHLGGNNFSANTFEQFMDNYQIWYGSINESNSVVISAYGQGLIPLWDILPTQYEGLRLSMIAAYENLCEEKYNVYTRLDSKDNPYHIVNPTLIREVSKTISDSGRYNQHYDTIDLGNYGISLTNLYNEGYRYVDIDVKMEHKEVQDGYRHMYIYKDKTKSSSSNLSEFVFEIEENGKDKVTYYTKGTYTFPSFNLNDLDKQSNKLFIRYGASGQGDDSWVNKNISISFIFRK